MAHYRTCLYCWCNAASDEICDCHAETRKEAAPQHREQPQVKYPISVYQAHLMKSREVQPWQKN